MFKCFFRFWCNRPLFNRAKFSFLVFLCFFCSIFVALSLLFFCACMRAFFSIRGSVLFCFVLSASLFFFFCSSACCFSLVSFLSLSFFFSLLASSLCFVSALSNSSFGFFLHSFSQFFFVTMIYVHREAPSFFFLILWSRDVITSSCSRCWQKEGGGWRGGGKGTEQASLWGLHDDQKEKNKQTAKLSFISSNTALPKAKTTLHNVKKKKMRKEKKKRTHRQEVLMCAALVERCRIQHDNCTCSPVWFFPSLFLPLSPFCPREARLWAHCCERRGKKP